MPIRLKLYCIIVLLMCTSETECQDFFSGYYSYHPAYMHDMPAPDHYTGPIPFGLPMGGFSMGGKGPAYGLQAYIVRGVIPIPWTVPPTMNIENVEWISKIPDLQYIHEILMNAIFWRKRR
jgi:hypothetical protein